MKDRARYSFVELTNHVLTYNIVCKLVYLAQKCLLHMLKFDNYQFYKTYLKVSRALSLTAYRNFDILEDKFILLLNSGKFSSGPFVQRIFWKSTEAKDIYQEFKLYGPEFQTRIKFPRSNDVANRQGDLIVLKPYVDKTEKGVLLIQYNDSMKRFATIYDLPKLAKYYRIILEPSTWGYQYVEFINFFGIDTDVIVESQREEDFVFINKLGANLIPVRIGAGDWMDPDLFKQSDDTATKKYDLIMVASWLCLKRHDLLFMQLSKIKNQISKIALVGYPLNSRSIDDIKCAAERCGVSHLVDYFEQIPNEEVSKLLSLSRFSLMLSKREGANKAIYESFFTNVPVVVSECNVGINRDHVNDNTGIFSSDKHLHEAILNMKSNFNRYSPREWAMTNTGCYNSSRNINKLLMEISISKGHKWTVDLYQRKGSGKHIVFSDQYYAKADAEFYFMQQNLLRSDL